MRIERGLVVALAAFTGACAASAGGGAGGGPAGGSSSLPQVTCSTGNAVATAQATAAQGALNRTLITQGDARIPFYSQALTQSQAGIAADAQNPYHYYLAGQAYVGLDSLGRASEMFRRTVEVCPEFSTEVNPLLEQAWAQGLQTGLTAYQAGDTARALAVWQQASQIYRRRPDVFFNLAVVSSQTGNTQAAIENYRLALAVVDSTPEDTMQAVIQSEADMRAGALTGLLSAGAALFQRDQFREASAVFRELNTVDPANRDAWYNHALALYKLEDWSGLIPVASRLVQLDPLNYNAQIILFNAYKGVSEVAKAQNNAANERRNRELALSTLERAEGLPVQVDGVSLTNQQGSVRVAGTVTGANARAGSPVTLEFTVTGPGGDLGTQSVTVNAPAKDQNANFELTIPVQSPATSWRYRVGS